MKKLRTIVKPNKSPRNYVMFVGNTQRDDSEPETNVNESLKMRRKAWYGQRKKEDDTYVALPKKAKDEHVGGLNVYSSSYYSPINKMLFKRKAALDQGTPMPKGGKKAYDNMVVKKVHSFLVNQKTKRTAVVMSGCRYPPPEAGPGDIIHNPAFTSTTFSHRIALDFSSPKNHDGTFSDPISTDKHRAIYNHALVIHIPKGTSGVSPLFDQHHGSLSVADGVEHEVLINHGALFRIRKTQVDHKRQMVYTHVTHVGYDQRHTKPFIDDV